MSCCSRKRAQVMAAGGTPSRPRTHPQFAGTAVTPSAVSGGAATQIAVARPLLRVVFECIGDSALTVTSPSTGRRYHFASTGARLEVDRRDRLLLAGVTLLRQVT